MKKIFVICLIIVLVFALISCGFNKELTDEEVQEIFDKISGNWRFTDEFLEQANANEGSELLGNLTITIHNDGTWFEYSKEDDVLTDDQPLYIGAPEGDNVPVKFVFEDGSEEIFTYNMDTDKFFIEEESLFIVSITDVLVRK